MNQSNSNSGIRATRGAQRDVIAGGILFAAIILFVGTGGSVVSAVVRQLQGVGETDNLMVTALLLNIALIIFGWRRYRELMSEMGERIAAEDRANKLAVTDPLTGLANRRGVAEDAAELFMQARKSQRQLAFLMLDLDDFKRINDLYGHEAGDAVLSAISARMREITPPEALLARLGGDEFGCVILYDADAPETVETMASNLVESIARPVVHEKNAFDINQKKRFC